MTRVRLIIWQLTICLLLSGSSGVVYGQWLEEFGHVGIVKKLQGQVRNGADEAIPDAIVNVTNTATSQTIEIKADDKGRFKRDNLPRGTYQVRVTARGHNLGEYTIKIDAKDKNALNRYTAIRLSPGCASGNSGVSLINKINAPSFSRE